MLIETQATVWRKGLATNSDATSFASKVNTLTEPTGDGVHNVGWGPPPGPQGGVTYNAILIHPYAVAGDNDTFSMRVIGWSLVRGSGTVRDLWIPTILCELACTCSADVGVANSAVLATERFADTLALVGTSGTLGTNVDVFSPTGNVKGHAVIDLKGSQKLEFTFDSTSAGATGMNALFKGY